MSEILNAVETVNRQVSDIAQAAKHRSGLSNELVAATDAVSAVVEENTAATEEMSAQVEEVSSSAQSLAEMAQALRQVVAQFKLADQEPGAAPQSAPRFVQPISRSNGKQEHPVPIPEKIILSHSPPVLRGKRCFSALGGMNDPVSSVRVELTVL